MVTNPRAKTRADQLRPLGLPKPITVLTERELPAVLIEGKRRQRVARVQDSWRIDDEWWRQPISRRYYQLLLEDGRVRTIFHDLIADSWHEQTY